MRSRRPDLARFLPRPPRVGWHAPRRHEADEASDVRPVLRQCASEVGLSSALVMDAAYQLAPWQREMTSFRACSFVYAACVFLSFHHRLEGTSNARQEP